jgi:hypothetical protein
MRGPESAAGSANIAPLLRQLILGKTGAVLGDVCILSLFS